MKCEKCNAAIPDKSKFCLVCGASVEKKVDVSEEPIADTPSVESKTKLIAIITALVIIALIAVFMALSNKGSKLTSANKVDGEQMPILNAPSPNEVPQPGVLQANPANVGPQTGLLQGAENEPPAQKPAPPAEVLAYLEHVKKVEQYRQTMRLDLSPAFDMLAKANSLKGEFEQEAADAAKQSIDKEYSNYVSKWQQIAAYFNSVPAPPPCQTLAGAYGDALGKYSAIMIKIQYSLIKKDINTLMQMKDKAQGEVDQSLINADNELSTVCKTYGINKSFAVQPDKGMDSLLSTGF